MPERHYPYGPVPDVLSDVRLRHVHALRVPPSFLRLCRCYERSRRGTAPSSCCRGIKLACCLVERSAWRQWQQRRQLSCERHRRGTAPSSCCRRIRLACCLVECSAWWQWQWPQWPHPHPARSSNGSCSAPRSVGTGTQLSQFCFRSAYATALPFAAAFETHATRAPQAAHAPAVGFGGGIGAWQAPRQ